jgi:hypothetical protein
VIGSMLTGYARRRRPNLALAFSDFGPEPLLPWPANLRAPTDPRSVQEVADELATQRRQGLCSWGISEGEIVASLLTIVARRSRRRRPGPRACE